ncbi:MAG: DUF692 family multinuclear iron-containing protein [Planctomycetota bacterium]
MTGLFPYLGAGIGFRRPHYDDLLERCERRVDWLEVVSENYMDFGGHRRHVLAEARGRWPVIPHGVALDVGGPAPLDEDYLDRLAGLVERLDPPFVSDHLCFSTIAGVHTHELLPLPFREEVVEHVAARARAVQERLGRPLLLENPSYYVVMPGQELSEAEFIRAVCERSDTGLLLDVNNLYVNAVNHGYDAVAFLDQLPLERVGYVHLAGHLVDPRALIDNHGSAVPEPVWGVFRALLERTGPVSALVEWDLNIPTLDLLLDEADKARAILEEFGG